MALIGVSQLNAVMMRRFGTLRLLLFGTAAASLAGMALAGLVLGGMTALWPVIVLTLTLFACLGLVLGPAFLTAMEPFGATAAGRAALGGRGRNLLSAP